MQFFKQCVGIDIAKDTFSVCLASMSVNQELIYQKQDTFSNDTNGYGKFDRWVSKHKIGNLPVWYVIEATGVYYENLAYHLSLSTSNISVLVPSRVKHFAKSLEIKTKTDLIDAKILAQLGLERKLDPWRIVSPKIRQLKQLSREYRINKADLNRLKNRLHAKQHSYGPDPGVLRRLKSKIRLLEHHCVSIECELKEIVAIDQALDKKIDQLISIPGLSFMTVVCIVAETNGFASIRNAKQLASFAGLDVVHYQSGKKLGKPKISKKGNRFIRHALYMPALAATLHNHSMKVFYERIIVNKPSKKIGVTAVARKMLILAYVLWKNDEYFKTNVESQKHLPLAIPS